MSCINALNMSSTSAGSSPTLGVLLATVAIETTGGAILTGIDGTLGTTRGFGLGFGLGSGACTL
jgi:hypothetical protein